MDGQPDQICPEQKEYGSEIGPEEDSIYKHHYVQAKERDQAQSLERPQANSKRNLNASKATKKNLEIQYQLNRSQEPPTNRGGGN